MDQMSANQRIIFRLGQSIVEAETMQDQIRVLTEQNRSLAATNTELEAKVKASTEEKPKTKAK